MDNYKMFFKHQKNSATNDLYKFLTQYGVLTLLDFILLEYLFGWYSKELSCQDSFCGPARKKSKSVLDEGEKDFFFISLSDFFKKSQIYEYFTNDEMILAKLAYYSSLWILEYHREEDNIYLRFSDKAFTLFNEYQLAKDTVSHG